jgi:NodT family efflux transporter outer membrane factor (OMF) lipoprotein
MGRGPLNMSASSSRAKTIATFASWAALAAVSLVAGCMVGPDYKSPPVQTTADWKMPSTAPTTAPTTQVSSSQLATQASWWKAFNDPVLDRLVELAYHQNLTLQVAGLRVIEARAQRGISVGNFFPQSQAINGSYSRNGLSEHNANAFPNQYFENTSASFDVNWEVDVWGKFRRGIESSDATLYSSVMNYDDALVTLVADVATDYVNLRALDERIKLANENVVVEQNALDIANIRFRAGGASELDVQQARVQLANTQASVPALQAARDQAEDQLCVLLGIPPKDLSEILGHDFQPMPLPPESMALGIPADLLRRRPDVRRAEADAAAQSSQIGVATADLLPHFQLFGSIGYTAAHPEDVFNASSLAYQVGPSFRWDILNYGRILSNVRVQDARFEQLLTNYQNTVITAQQEVADSLTAFQHSREQSVYLADSVDAALRAVDISMTQYKAGGADYIRVLIATQFLVNQQDALVVSRTNIATSAIAMNKALGGGWEIHREKEFVPAQTIERMRDRTNWGDITANGDYESGKDVFVVGRPKSTTPPFDSHSNSGGGASKE